jgi:hypothetical protein
MREHDQSDREFWQAIPAHERIEETWRLSEELAPERGIQRSGSIPAGERSSE